MLPFRIILAPHWSRKSATIPIPIATLRFESPTTRYKAQSSRIIPRVRAMLPIMILTASDSGLSLMFA